MINYNSTNDPNIFTLEKWYINQTDYGCLAHGKVYNNPKFRKGKNIHTSTILKIEKGETEYFIHTLNSVYALPMDSHTGNEDMEEIFNYISLQLKRAVNCAEKLLSEGDSLFFDYNVFYRTPTGIITLPHQKSPDSGYIRYIYENDGFELQFYNIGIYTVKFNEAHRKGALYDLSFTRKYLKKTDYLAADMTNERNAGVYYEQSLPF